MQKVDNKKDNEEKDFAHVVISWDKTIYRKFLENIENTHFFA